MRTLLLTLSFLIICTSAYPQFWKKKKKNNETNVADTTLVAEIDTTTQQVIDTLTIAEEPYILSERDTITDYDIVLPSILEEDSLLLTDWYSRNYVVIDTTCIQPTVIPSFSDTIIAARLASLPTLIEMPYNQIVGSYIDTYTRRSRSLTSYLLGASDHYLPLFEQELEKAGLPLELKYLPIIESALKPQATSRVGAAGLWQFMIATGKMYGLEVNSLVDERRDPIKSTQAAVKFLQDLYAMYNDWTLAIAAYNCGPGNVNKAIRRTGGKRDYWQIYYYLPRETRGYVPAFIAANYAMNFYEEHEICPAYVEIPQANDTVMITKEIDLIQVAKALDTPIEQVRLLNPQYRADIVPGNTKPYALRLPNEELLAFIDQQDTIISRSLVEKRHTVAPAGYSTIGSSPSGPYTLHKIKSGESLSTIAQRYGISVSTLKQWNNLYSTRITAGKSLRIYGKTANTKSEPASKESVEKYANWSGDVSYHTVKSGENLWLIAQKYPGVSADNIKALNKLNSNNLKIGQRLKIPKV